ncbi:VOC family protein [Microlunatus sp. Gsoil 973]|uniref:VOC family protein n=1 Tax=Microlunatus sp. Gsoil 973 TaxID=2672569 RepID=UPI0012B4B5B5|nr:VOC family protein [Microlunatus sp. Gsoil 973]QGN31707.1 VOC family protein [Microlunatus sp. Gsoil 973]
MSARLNPYLSFRDTARPAMEFYQSVFGGDLSISTFGDMHLSEDAAEQDKVMHASLETPGGLTLMASDTPAAMELITGNNITVSLSGDDQAELRGYWEKLSDGGQVTMPFEQAPWGDIFGMCTDKFGVAWMIDAVGPQQG